jgi:hypothetical protein
MSKQNKIHMVYTIQVKSKTTKALGHEQVEDLVDSINDTLKAWFPKGQVELVKHDILAADKRVVITNVLPAVQRRSAPAKPRTATEVVEEMPKPELGTYFDGDQIVQGDGFNYSLDAEQKITAIWNPEAAAKEGIKLGEKITITEA